MTTHTRKNSAFHMTFHRGPVLPLFVKPEVESFRCPGCDSTVAVDLRPEGAYPWPPHYVCPICEPEDDAPAAQAPVAAKPVEPPPAEPATAEEPAKEPEEKLPATEHHRRTQRQLELLKDDDNPPPE